MTEQTLPKPVVHKLMNLKKFAQKVEDRTLVLEWSDSEDGKAEKGWNGGEKGMG